MNKRTLTLFTGAILLLVLVAAATGVFYQTAGAHITFITVRGEHATYQGSGLYHYDPASVAREGIVWDVIDLCLALPLFVVAIVLTWRGSLRGQLLPGGMVVPLLLSTAILLWRRSAWGYLLGGVSLTFGFIMCITLPARIVVPLIQVGQVNLIEAVPVLLLCLIRVFVAGRIFSSVHAHGIAHL